MKNVRNGGLGVQNVEALWSWIPVSAKTNNRCIQSLSYDVIDAISRGLTGFRDE